MKSEHAPASANFLGSSFDILMGLLFLLALLLYQTGTITLSPEAYKNQIPADFYKDFQTVEKSGAINPEIIADFEMMMNLENNNAGSAPADNHYTYVPGEPQPI